MRSSKSEAKRLILMRHAKSDWADASRSDHDRPLNARGHRDAPRIAHWLLQNDFKPDLILSSTSLRTLQTAQKLNESWPRGVTIVRSESLYLATLEQIFAAVRHDTFTADGTSPETLLVLAHNPGISDAVSRLVVGRLEMPTAGVVIFECDFSDWSVALSPGNVRMISQMFPKLLDD